MTDEDRLAKAYAKIRRAKDPDEAAYAKLCGAIEAIILDADDPENLRELVAEPLLHKSPTFR
jgi:hypothetical protein